MIQHIVHYGNHFLVPFLVAYFCFPSCWKKLTLIWWLTMLVDVDHLLATPIFDPNRCSVFFHFFHSWWAMVVYLLGLFWKKTRWFSVGLLWHIATDSIDCWWP